MLEMVWRWWLAVVWVLGVGYVSYSVALRMLRRADTWVLWSATCVVGLGLSVGGFWLLFSVRQYSLWGVSGLVGLGVVGALRFVSPWRETLRSLQIDVWFLGEVCRVFFRGWRGWVVVVFLVWAIAKDLRVLLLPPLSWDTLTYHAPRAAMWIQSGGPIAMEAPGGWSYQKYFLPGSDILLSLAMLPFRSDVWLPLVDIVQWWALGWVLFALGRELGLRAGWAVVGVLFYLTIPLVLQLVGSGYSEIGFSLCFALALLFAVRFEKYGERHDLYFSGLALGVFACIKFHGVVLSVGGGMGLLGLLFWRRGWSGWKEVCVVSMLWGAMVLPWFGHTWSRKGTPLYPMEVKVAGIRLGEASPALKFYGERPELKPYTREELYLFNLFYGTKGQPFSLLLLGMLLLFFPAWLAGWRVFPWRMVFWGGLVALNLALYFHPNFSVVRMILPLTSARFLLPCVMLCVWVFWWLQKQGVLWQRVGMGVVGVWVLLSLSVPWQIERSPSEWPMLGVGLGVVLLCMCGVVLLCWMRWVWGAGVVLLCAAWGASFWLQEYKDATRMRAIWESAIYHRTSKDWKYLAEAFDKELVDSKRSAVRVAVTSAVEKNGDNWPLYLFMGNRLQHQVCYVPITRGDEVLPYGEGRTKAADRASWLKRLHKQNVDYIVFFSPTPATEQFWVVKHPELFRPVLFSMRKGGLVRVRKRLLAEAIQVLMKPRTRSSTTPTMRERPR